MSVPKVAQEYYPLSGGLDLLTPAIAIESGKVIDSQNYEPEIAGGYRRIDGYERYDGRPSPSTGNYWTLAINQTMPIAIGSTIVGGSSGATARLIGTFGKTLILGRVTGTFNASEVLTVSAVAVGMTTTLAYINSATSASDHADYTLLAANDYRADILVVPGSGPVRGVWIYSDTVYAFRDNAAGTAGAMFKATAAGWVQVNFGTEIQFTSNVGGTSPITAGQTIANLGAAPTKTATVIAVLTRSGTWGTDAAGTLIIAPVTGVFSSADPVFVGATQKATATTAATAIARLPGGRMEFNNANFVASAAAQKMYGCDGVNLAFEFDGTNYIPIRTGMLVDTPTHVIFHRFYLFLSFKGSVQFSAVTNPYAWSAVLGAGEIGVSDDVAGFVPQGGTNAGSSMAIFTKQRTYILYGSSSANWNLVTSIYDLGYSAFTMQPVSNNTYGLTPRGIQSLITTLSYGDFDYASIAHQVMPFITARRGLEIASNSLRAKDQYRLYFSDGYALAMGLTGDSVNGVMPLFYGKAVRTIVTTTLSTGNEVTFFGSDDGYVYQDNLGTSFDGAAIESWCRLPFNHSKSPQIRKRYRRAVFDVKVVSYSKVNISYDIGYAGSNANAPAPNADQLLVGGGGYWDQFTWDQFTWDSKLINQPTMALEGTERNISMLFYSNRNQDTSHTLQGIALFYTPQRSER